MANFLAGLTNLTQAASAGISGAASSGSIASGIQTGLSALLGAGSLQGTKPKALHTEHASGEANWEKPYGSSTDIVFYLVRADKGAQNKDYAKMLAPEGALPFVAGLSLEQTENVGPIGEGVFSSAGQTGPGFPTNIQSPLNQVAAKSAVDKLSGSVGAARGLAGPLTGLASTATASVGNFSQTFAQLSSTAASVQNMTQSVDSLNSLRLSAPSSEKFFTDVLQNSFIPGSAQIGNTIRSAEQIASAFDSGAIADLASQLAVAAGGVTSAKQLIEGINKGAIGFTTQSSGAEAERLGPKGFSRERLAK